jgi:ubiquinone/menaquinone biosynthesis C-methylase UbiE
MESFIEVNKAFSNQSIHYDDDDIANPILQAWRQQVYDHVNQFIKPSRYILELNSGTGIDALHFVNQGHRVHCVELSDGMVREINSKIHQHNLETTLSVQQLSYEKLDEVKGKFDYVFSNFGGLNCSSDLKKVTKHLQPLLNPGATITWVVMPPICLWEISWMLKGNFKDAFRRFHKKT